jgi:hypothetical protein
MVTYFYWWYAEEPVYLWRAIIIVTRKIFHSFSVPLLFRTLFDPWKRDASSAENASFQTLYQIWLNNLVSRLVGFVVRLFTIFTGLLLTTLFFLVATLCFLTWLILPVIIMYLLVSGIEGIYGYGL